MNMRKTRFIILTCAAIIGAAFVPPAAGADELLAVTADVKSSEQQPYDKSYIGDMEVYTAAYEDTLVKIARDNNLGFVELRAANPYIDPWIPGKAPKSSCPNDIFYRTRRAKALLSICRKCASMLLLKRASPLSAIR